MNLNVETLESKIYSARVLPNMEKGFRDRGLLTALITLESPRFRSYLKKPANLLHDRWDFVGRGDNREVIYSLGTPRGLRQELTISPRQGHASLHTSDPSSGAEQTMVFDLRNKRVVSNTVSYELGSREYDYIHLNRQEGVLKALPVVAEELALEAC